MAWTTQAGREVGTRRRPARRTEAADIKLVVFDLAGTLVDHGSRAPLDAFLEVFRTIDLDLTVEEAKAPMGLDKEAHIRAILAAPSVAARFSAKRGRAPHDGDVAMLYERFVPLQLAAIERRATLVAGALETIAELRERDIKIATTTGYFRAAAGRVVEAMQAQGLEADVCTCSDDVEHGRPAPFMIFRAMQALDVFPPTSVVKVGDTPYDIEEGLNAGAWAIGVAQSGNLVGLTAEEWQALPEEAQRARLTDARDRLLRAGAHRVIDTVAELPRLLDLL